MVIKNCQKIVHSQLFENAIIGIIIVNAIVIGLETSKQLVADYGAWFILFHKVILGIFIVEALLKITAEAPRIDRYFRQGWNIFDFSIIILSFLPSGQFAMTARLVRVLRVARLITVIPELRLIIFTLLRSLPSMFHIVILLGVLFYIYGVTGYYFFHTTDPENWGNLGASLLTLFGVVTLETWVDVMSVLLPTHPFAWIYFVSFIVMGTFMFVNLFVAVVINNLAEAKEEKLKELESVPSKDELIKELEDTKNALMRLERKLKAKS